MVKKRGIRIDVYVHEKNEDYVKNLREKRQLSTWFNEQCDRARRLEVGEIETTLEKQQKELKHLQYDIDQTENRLKEAKIREEERKKRLESIYKQDLINPF